MFSFHVSNKGLNHVFLSQCLYCTPLLREKTADRRAHASKSDVICSSGIDGGVAVLEFFLECVCAAASTNATNVQTAECSTLTQTPVWYADTFTGR